MTRLSLQYTEKPVLQLLFLRRQGWWHMDPALYWPFPVPNQALGWRPAHQEPDPYLLLPKVRAVAWGNQ